MKPSGLRRPAPPSPFLCEPRTIESPTAIVHLEYDPAKLDPLPNSDEWTRFVCISDTHAHTFKVPDGDVLLHSGDLTNTGTLREFEATLNWLCSLPHKVKIIIAGNHDLTLHEDWYGADNWKRWHRSGQEPVMKIKELLRGKKALAAGLVYLQSEQHTFQIKEGRRQWSVYGSPWSPHFFNWAFNYQREEGEALVSKFPKTDILLTHGPPYGVFDQTSMGDRAGCKALLARLSDLRPRVHLAGHIHEARGACIHTWRRNQAGHFVSPKAQNHGRDLKLRPRTDKSDEDDEDSEPSDEELGNETTNLKLAVELDSTVFVNAANAPSGKLAWRETTNGQETRVGYGEFGFQPVVVDLKDNIDAMPTSST